MMHTRLAGFALLPILVCAPAAHAQEQGRTGLVMGLPAAIGFIWHASENVALRPELGFGHGSSETENSTLGSTTSNDVWTLNLGVSVPWYFARTDNVRTYFSPRVAYGRNSTESSASTLGPVVSHTVSASGSFGAQYSPVRKFSVYGEAGYGVTRGSAEFNTPISRTTNESWTWAIRSSVGVIFYFGRS